MEVSPHAIEGGYVHRSTVFAAAIQQQIDAIGIVVPMPKHELEEYRRKDIGANGDPAIVEVTEDTYAERVTVTMDLRTAAVAMYAMRLLAADSEAHAREVKDAADRLPEGSYGYTNRMGIAIRRERIARRMRAVEEAYRMAVDTEFHGI